MDNIGILAVNANTEDVYSAVEDHSKSRKGADNESDEKDLFDSDSKQNSEWSHGKLTKFVNDNVKLTTVSTSVSLHKSMRSECKTGFGQKRKWDQSDMEFQCWNGEKKGNEATVHNQEGKFRIMKIDLEAEEKSGLNLFKR